MRSWEQFTTHNIINDEEWLEVNRIRQRKKTKPVGFTMHQCSGTEHVREAPEDIEKPWVTKRMKRNSMYATIDEGSPTVAQDSSSISFLSAICHPKDCLPYKSICLDSEPSRPAPCLITNKWSCRGRLGGFLFRLGGWCREYSTKPYIQCQQTRIWCRYCATQ